MILPINWIIIKSIKWQKLAKYAHNNFAGPKVMSTNCLFSQNPIKLLFQSYKTGKSWQLRSWNLQMFGMFSVTLVVWVYWWQCQSAYLSVDHFGQVWNISTSTEWIDQKFHADINGNQKVNLNMDKNMASILRDFVYLLMDAHAEVSPK